MSNSYAKVVYWDRSYRIVRKEAVPIIEEKIAAKVPFRMHHSNGIDFVQPGAIALITDPSHSELPYVPAKNALPEGEKEPEVPLPSEIMGMLRIAMKSPKVERKWWLEQFRIASKKWKDSGIIEVPSKYNEGERNGQNS